MRGRLWLVLLLGFLMVAVSASVANASRKVSLTDTLEVAATVEKYAVSFIKNPLTFNISGAVGSYRETKTATYSLEVNTPVRVVFSASPLAYISDPRYVLDVTYWVNSHRSKFRPGEDLTLIANYAGVQTSTTRSSRSSDTPGICSTSGSIRRRYHSDSICIVAASCRISLRCAPRGVKGEMKVTRVEVLD